MHALIVDTEVVELRPDDEVFTVVSGWYWVPVPEKFESEIDTLDWTYDRETDTFKKKPPYQSTGLEDRLGNYPTFGEQFDMLWNDINDGKLGEDAKSGSWYLAIKAVKDKYPLQ